MQKTETELGGVDLSNRRRVIKTTIRLVKREEAKAEAARGRHADGKLITPDAAHAVVFTATLSAMPIENFDDGARNDFAAGVAAGLGVPRDSVRVTCARAGSVIVETSVTVHGGVQAAAAFAASLTDPAKPLVDESRFGPCAVSGVHIEEMATAAAPAEAAAVAPAVAAPAEAPAEPATSPAPGMAADGPLRSTVVVIHDDDDNRQPEEEIEGRDVRVEELAAAPAPAMTDNGPLRSTVVVLLHDDDGNRHAGKEVEGRDGRRWDYDGKLGEKNEAVRQHSYVAPRDSGAAVGLGLQLGWTISDDFRAERSTYTGVLTHREESLREQQHRRRRT